MDAVIIAGGLGTRLGPLTARHPKHLLPVAGLPFLAHQIAKLARAGVGRVVIATSYRAEEFEPVLGSGAEFGLELVYVAERERLGTAGAIRNAAALLVDTRPADPVIVLNGDILSDHDLAAQVRRHVDTGARATLHLVEVADASPYGSVPTDERGRVTAFLEKSPDPPTRQVNAGCYVVARGVIDEIPAGRPVSIERETFPLLVAADQRVMAYLESSYWLDLGTPAAFLKASSDLVRGVARSPAYADPGAESLVLPSARVDPRASVRGGSTICPGAVVQCDVSVDGSIVLGGAFVEAGARVDHSVVGPGARIGRDSVLCGAVVGDGARVGTRSALVDGAVVWCDVELADGSVRHGGDARVGHRDHAQTAPGSGEDV